MSVVRGNVCYDRSKRIGGKITRISCGAQELAKHPIRLPGVLRYEALTKLPQIEKASNRPSNSSSHSSSNRALGVLRFRTLTKLRLANMRPTVPAHRFPVYYGFRTLTKLRLANMRPTVPAHRFPVYYVFGSVTKLAARPLRGPGERAANVSRGL